MCGNQRQQDQTKSYASLSKFTTLRATPALNMLYPNEPQPPPKDRVLPNLDLVHRIMHALPQRENRN